MSRRTETSYKAQSPGKLAQHNEAPGSGDRSVTFGDLEWRGCAATVHVLIRGDLAELASVAVMEVGLRPSLKGLEPPPNPKTASGARYTATCVVIGQKSAEAIVAQRLE